MALLLALTFVAAAASPAGASYQPNDSLRAGQRPRPGASTWVPRGYQFQAGWDPTNNRAYMLFAFRWEQNEHKEHLFGSQQFFEMSAQVDCSWSRTYVPAGYNPNGEQGYHGGGWSTNIPGYALPYEDTTYLETCEASNTPGDRGTYGIGVLNAAALVPGTTYYAHVWLQNPGNLGFAPPISSSVKLTVGTGTAYDSNNPVPPMLGGDCAFNNTEIANWNAATSAGLGKRLQASWCAWQDWSHTVVKDDGSVIAANYYNAPFYGSIGANKLYNQGMEEPTSAPGAHVGPGTAYGAFGSATRYCQDTFSAYDGSCFVQFNATGSPWASVYQDTTLDPGPRPTVEAAMRCRKGSGQRCDGSLGFFGFGGSNPQESRFVGFHDGIAAGIPDDGYWYICRMDENHGNGATLAYSHPTFRWQVYGDIAANMDVDYTFLGGRTIVNDPDNELAGVEIPGVGDIGPGPVCTRRN